MQRTSRRRKIPTTVDATTETLHQDSPRTLRTGQWTNDVIDIYNTLLDHREEAAIRAASVTYRPTWCYRCAFWHLATQLFPYDPTQKNTYNYENLRQWSRHIFHGNLFALNSLVMPINLDNGHWICVVASFPHGPIAYF